MDKGIRPACNAKFTELNAKRVAGELTNTAFRKAVMAFIMEEYGITLASAATHYNHSLQQAKAATPTLVEGLGRPEDKKGGRKPKAKPAAEATPQGDATPAEFVDAESVVQTEWEVRKKSDNTVIATGLTFEAAKALVDRAAAQKKAKLYFV